MVDYMVDLESILHTFDYHLNYLRSIAKRKTSIKHNSSEDFPFSIILKNIV